jgi:hypothetical protein
MSMHTTICRDTTFLWASYVQLQLAHCLDVPMEAKVLAELTRLTYTKQRFLKDPVGVARDVAAVSNTAISAHTEELSVKDAVQFL